MNERSNTETEAPEAPELHIEERGGVVEVYFGGTRLYWSTSYDAAKAFIAGYNRGWDNRGLEGA